MMNIRIRQRILNYEYDFHSLQKLKYEYFHEHDPQYFSDLRDICKKIEINKKLFNQASRRSKDLFLKIFQAKFQSDLIIHGNLLKKKTRLQSQIFNLKDKKNKKQNDIINMQRSQQVKAKKFESLIEQNIQQKNKNKLRKIIQQNQKKQRNQMNSLKKKNNELEKKVCQLEKSRENHQERIKKVEFKADFLGEQWMKMSQITQALYNTLVLKRDPDQNLKHSRNSSTETAPKQNYSGLSVQLSSRIKK